MIKTNKIFIPIPRKRNTQAKVEIKGDDRANKVIESIWKYPVTSGVGTFIIILSNAAGQLNGLYSDGDEVKFYADNSDGSRLQFFGIIDSVKDNIGSGGQTLEIGGRHRSYLLTEFLISYSSIGNTTSNILKEIIDLLPSSYGFTKSNIEDSSVTMDVEWNYKPFWDCVVELCDKGISDCYADNDLDFHYFAKNSKINDREYVVEGNNFLKSKGFGKDAYYEKTRVIASGNSSGGLPIIYTAISDQEGENIKEILIKDTSSNTVEKVRDLAQAKLAVVSNREEQATVESFGLETLVPGENIWILIPRQEIHGQYKVVQVTHRYGAKSGGWRTECQLEEEERGMAQTTQTINQKSDRLKDISNIHKLNFSWNFDFAEDSGTHSNTKIVDGFLKTVTGSSGVWTSEVLELEEDISAVEAKIAGTSLVGTQVWLSVNGGISFQQLLVSGLSSKDKEIIAGRRLKLQVRLVSESTQVDDLVLLYS